MKLTKIFCVTLALFQGLSVFAQTDNVREIVLNDRHKAAGLDDLVPSDPAPGTAIPEGYEAFYISHYGRHGSRYAYSSHTYKVVRDCFAKAEKEGNLTACGEKLHNSLKPFFDHALPRTGELTRKGWDQHQTIAERMYHDYPAAFEGNSRVEASVSPSSRAIMSMSSFCLALCRLNPQLRIMEYQGLIATQSTAPNSGSNPLQLKGMIPPMNFNESEESFMERHIDWHQSLGRLFKDPDKAVAASGAYELLEDMYMLEAGMLSLDDSIVPDTEGLFTDSEFAAMWEIDNYRRYREYYGYRTSCSSIVLDMIDKADARLAAGETGADLRFGHDHCLMTLLCIMDIEDFGHEPADPDDVARWFKTYRSPMATNIQLVFCRKADSLPLVKILLNGEETAIPSLESVMGPYYDWNALKAWLKCRVSIFVNE